jgi:hypothetical protein
MLSRRLIADGPSDVATPGPSSIVAVCEVNDTEILPALVKILSQSGKPWQSVTSPRVGNTSASSEHYGVLYRDDVFDLRTSRVLEKGPLREAGVAGLSPGEMFDREPFTATLATDDGRLDFAIIMVHVTYGNAVAPRRAEVRLLAGYDQEVASQEPDVLVCGDFNRSVGDQQSLEWLIEQGRLIGTASPVPPAVVRGHHTFDHIILDPRQTTEYHGVHGVILFDAEMFGGNKAAAIKAVSGHRSVSIELDVPEADDD